MYALPSRLHLFTAILGLLVFGPFTPQCGLAQRKRPVVDKMEPPHWWNEGTEMAFVLILKGENLADCKVSPEMLAGLVGLISDGTISGRIAKDVFADMFESGRDAAAIVDEKGLKQLSDSGAIEALIDTVIAGNMDKVEEYRGGKDKLFGFFVGQVMKQSGGQANPGMVNQILKAKLDG